MHTKLKTLAIIVFITNHKNSFVLEKGDRRYVFLQISESRIGDFAFWADLRNKCFNKATADAFYTYLCRLGADMLVELRHIPNTELKQEMLEISKPNIWKFIDWYQSDDNLLFKGEPVRPSELYYTYDSWCKRNNEKPTQSHKFYSELLNDTSRIEKKVIQKSSYYVFLQQKVIEPAKSTVVDFVDWFTSEDNLLFDDGCFKPKLTYLFYQRFCERNNLKPIPDYKFWTEVSADLRVTKKFDKRCPWYVFNKLL